MVATTHLFMHLHLRCVQQHYSTVLYLYSNYSEPPSKRAKVDNQRESSVERNLRVSDRKTNSPYKRTAEKGSGQGQHSIEDSNVS